MATQAQIEANRRNSQKSTGPITEQGKAAVARNAVRHGLFCRHLLVAEEDASEFDAFRDGMYARLEPADELERLYAERIVSNAWRMRLAIKAEASLFDFYARVSSSHWPAEDAMRQPSPADGLSRVQKYAAALERGLDKAMAELSRIQDRRRASEAKIAAEKAAANTTGNDAANQATDRRGEPSTAIQRAAEQIVRHISQNPISQNKANRLREDSGGGYGEASANYQNKANVGGGWGELEPGEDDWGRNQSTLPTAASPTPAAPMKATSRIAVGRSF